MLQLNTQPQTKAGGDIYEQHDKEDSVLSSDDEEVGKYTCAAIQLCRDPNNDTDNYCTCLNCNVDAHLICTKQFNFQTPALDKFVIDHRDLSGGGKERYRKTPMAHRDQVVFCLLCKARMLTKKFMQRTRWEA